MKSENVITVLVEDLRFLLDKCNVGFCEVFPDEINRLPFDYQQRDRAEHDFTRKQLIPYAIVKNSLGEILVYTRHGSEKRLSGMFSAGIGGHLNEKDKGSTLHECLISGLKREFEEEVGFRLENDRITLCGIINEDQSEVGLCHIGVVFLVSVNNEQLVFSTEICNPQWNAFENIDLDKFELWSRLAITLLNRKSA